MVKILYAVWIKIDETLPWIELKGEYQTRRMAKKAADEVLNNIEIKIVNASENRESLKALATAKTTR
jgi:hypothetical protein